MKIKSITLKYLLYQVLPDSSVLILPSVLVRLPNSTPVEVLASAEN